MKHRRIILAAEADLHGGSKGALLNPETELIVFDPKGNQTAYHPELNESQKYLWDLRTRNIKKTMELAGKDEVMVLQNGDITQGNKYHHLLVSNRIADQVIIAGENLRPWLQHKNVTNVRIGVGTAAHNFLSGTSEILIWEKFTKEYPHVNIGIRYHGNPTYNGLQIDWAHHGPGAGIRDWLRGNVAQLYLKSLMYECMKRQIDPPGLVLRAHVHVPVRAFNELDGNEAWLYILPSYSMLDDHADQSGQSPAFLTHGMVAFEIVDGKIVSEHRYYQDIDVRSKEAL